MPTVKPFNGVRYNPAKIKDFGKVVCPPYDIISEKMQDELYRKHANNLVRIEFGKISKSDTESDNRYTRARDFFDAWLKDGTLIRDAKRSFYIYSQTYKEGSRTIERVGFVGLMGLDMEKGEKVLPHENTLLAPKLDRIALIRTVHANVSPIFALYEDSMHKIARLLKKACKAGKPVADMTENGIRHRVWTLNDQKSIEVIEDFMRHKDIFIADGHHRFEVSRSYAQETAGDKNASAELKRNARSVMIYFVELDERMLTVLPAHRLIRDIGTLSKSDIEEKLKKFFRVEKAAGLKTLMKKLDSAKKGCVFGMYMDKTFYILKLKDPRISDSFIKDKPKDWKRLDVSILHLFVLKHVLGINDSDENVEFVKDPEETVDIIDSARCKLAFFLNPTKVAQVKKIARIGEKMPRKATYFYPKPLTGFIINKFA